MSPGVLEGMVLLETYRIERLLGKGGMGAVYAATHLRLPLRVAVKVLHAEAAANPEIFARFRREAEITSALRHPNIVQVIDFNRFPDGTPYLIMEYLDGEDLHARLGRVGRMPLGEVLSLARAVGAGLMAAHAREVVHRDLKPQNIFLACHDQGTERFETPKIVDFGISKIRHARTDTQATQEQQLLGTPHYMSPEQARGENSAVDHRTDQWALATILYQCLTGRKAFPADSLAGILVQVILEEPPALRTLAPEAPLHVEQAIQRALSKRREDRFPSVLELVRALTGEVGMRDSPPERGSTPLPRASSAARSGAPGSITGALGDVLPAQRTARRWPLALVSGVVLAVAAGVGGWSWLHRPPSPPVEQKTPEESGAPAETEAARDQVTLRVKAIPPEATVFVGDQRLPPGGVLRLPRGARKIEILATSPGYVETRVMFVPSRDDTVEVKLAAVSPAASGPPGSASGKNRDATHAGRSHHGIKNQEPADDAADVDIKLHK